MAAEASVVAAQAVARAHGVACDDAVLLAAGSNDLVHLRPAPVVARVMTGTAVLHDDVERWLSREVAVGSFLAERGDLAVPPTDLLPPGPHEQDGVWMTMWRFVAHHEDGPAPSPAQLGRALRELHVALAGFDGDLPPLSAVRDWLLGLLDDLDPTPPLTSRDLDDLRDGLDALTATVFESSLPVQALHGDASLSNLLRTGRGLVWNDLEDVCVGPVQWDLAGLVTASATRGATTADVAELVAAYRGPGAEGLEPFLAAHALYDVIWQAHAARSRPEALPRAARALSRFRRRA